jgi:hypothetical protein
VIRSSDGQCSPLTFTVIHCLLAAAHGGSSVPLLAQVRDLLGDGTTFKRRVKEGEGEFPADCPMHDCDIKCHYVARTIPDRTVVYGAASLALHTFPGLGSRPGSAVGGGYARR